MANQVHTTDLTDLNLIKRGKVRDVYELDQEHLLFIATDRISCFDVVLPTPISNKGKVLTQISAFWFDFTKNLIPNHFITTDVSKFDQLSSCQDIVSGRSMVVKKAKALPLECVVRGYLAGSGWKEYQNSLSVCGIKLPAGLKQSDKLPEYIFTPATKADQGHDENIDFESACKVVGRGLAEKMRDISIELYTKASDYALSKGIILADTKFEFGLIDDELVLIDEIFTPDSSRFWPKDQYQTGKSQPSFDKQFVRDYLETLDWDKTYPGPELPADIVSKTEEKYKEAYFLLTGKELV